MGLPPVLLVDHYEWGVSEYSKIENVSINNVKIDFVEKLMDSNGSEYYFFNTIISLTAN